jgi:AcrR family transcriptional regulator
VSGRGRDESRRSERAQRAIHDATAELLLAIGYDAMSMEGIAVRAGVGKQTIYRWWTSKAALVLDVWVETVSPRAQVPDTGDLAADLKAHLIGVVNRLSDPLLGSNFLSVVADSRRDERLAAELADRIFAPRIADCKQRLQAAQTADQLRKDVDLDTVIDLLFGAIHYRLLLRLRRPDRADIEALVDAALRGVGSPESRAG